MKKIIVGALSAWRYDKRRALCRETWIPDVIRLGHDVCFLMGVPHLAKPVRKGDMLSLPCEDSYPALPERTHQWCQWLLTQDFQYAFKNDDDSFLAARRLHDFVQTIDQDYVGVEWHCQMPYHSGGAGYLISRKAVEILAREMTPKVARETTSIQGAEDLVAGAILNRHGIPTYYRPDTMVGFHFEQRRPLRGNKFIAAHGRWLTEEMFRESYEHVKGE